MPLDPALVDQALAEATKRAENLDYFFDRLGSPEWIAPLRDRGFLSDPPEQFVDEQGFVHAPGWSESRYLARMAGLAPGPVLDVIEQLKTSNERVEEDFVDAALAMPPEEAIRVADLLEGWIVERPRIYYLLPRKTVQLICRLAADGAVDSAIALLRVLFAPLPDPRDHDWRPTLQARFTDWEYDHHLRTIIDEAVPLAPAAFLAALADLLNDALALLRDDQESEHDMSRVWRVRIADDRDRATEIEESLTSAVRDAAIKIREHQLLTDADVVALLTAHQETLFRRIAMHALIQEPEADLDVVLPFALDIDELLDGEPAPEFRELLVATAPRLTPSQIAELSAAILKGPDVGRFRELAEKYDGRAPTDDETKGYVGRWQIGRLALISGALPPEARETYEALVAQHGEAEIPLSWEVHTFSGPNSPITSDELALLSNDDLLAYLRDWEPGRQWGGEPSIEGLARAMAAVTEREPMRISGLAQSLKGLRPAYVQAAVSGFEAAIREQRSFNWSAVLDLLRWITEQPREIPNGRGDEYSDLDPGWVWTRREIAGLVERGLSDRGACAVPFNAREHVWQLIAAVSEDPNPTPEEEQKFGGKNMDPATLSLNTARPRGVRAAAFYAIWVYQQVYGDDQPADDFLATHAPEVAELLDAHLDPERDPSSAVRAVYGQFFANLFALDSNWATTRAPRIFPSEDSPLRIAAWGSYVIFTPPYTNVFALLRGVYLRAAELASEDTSGFRWMNGDLASRLGEHIATFLWRDIVTLDDDLLITFWSNAPTSARAHTIAFVGRSAREAQLDPDVQRRLMAFWAWVKENVRAGEEAAELREFAWWFSSTDLPAEWRFAEIIELLGKGIEPEPAFLVTEALPGLTSEHPQESLRTLRLLLENGDTWAADAWREHIEAILQPALRSENDAVRRTAQELLDWLLARGNRGLRSIADS